MKTDKYRPIKFKMEKCSDEKLSEPEIVQFEKKYGVRIPDDLKEFLLECNGGTPYRNKFRYKKGNKYKSFEIERVYDLDEYEFFRNREDYEEETYDNPDLFGNLILFAHTEDAGHTEICISVNKRENGKVYIVRDMREDSMVLLAESFTEFINGFISPFENEFEEACHYNDEQKALELLKNGFDINSKGIYDQSLLKLAIKAESDFEEVIKLLLEKGAKSDGALSIAAAYGNLKKVKLLIEGGVDINEKLPGGGNMPPISLASSNAKIEILEYLLENNADYNLADGQDKTPMDWAVFRKNQFPHRAEEYQKVIDILNKYQKS